MSRVERAPRPGAVFTIGYEGAAVPAFLATLGEAGVSTLIDVRALAWSRRRDFSRSALAACLTEAGIAYHHLPALGNPKPGRDAARAGDHAGFLRVFSAQLDGEAGRAGLAQATAIAAREPTCLLCLERDPGRCHRTIVAREIATAAALEVHPLVVPPPA